MTSKTSKLSELAYSLSPIERNLLPLLKDKTTIQDLVNESTVSDAQVKRAAMWLSNRKILVIHRKETSEYVLEENGLLAKKHGLAEVRILKSLLNGPQTVNEITSKTLSRGEIMASIGVLKSLQAIKVSKQDNNELLLEITPAGQALTKEGVYELQEQFFLLDFPLDAAHVTSNQQVVLKQLSKRKKFLKKQQIVIQPVTLTQTGKDLVDAVKNSTIDFSDLEEQLTSDMLASGSWKQKIFRTYDVTSPVPKIGGGRRHPLREACNSIRDVYLEMGFKEMSGPWVETAFWCMDSMWIPQDHPARDEQDTFFVGTPDAVWKGKLPQNSLVTNVKNAHEHGLNTGSTGHTKKWDPELAKQLVLRTHSTATTFRMFYEQGLGTKDGKYFYISNNFRNEAVDATHLAEFLQVEGFIVGDSLTLADLMGVIKEFYARFGIYRIRFKPTFNPYTEPSMEAHYYDEEKQKWYALINSGIFRPEALAPFGITKTVIAWGMGGSRVAALLNNKNNLRELVGPTVDIDWLAHHITPTSNLEKHSQTSQESEISQEYLDTQEGEKK
ncbi:MAG: phenylalanine--tRNA ligase subunit alpha [Candidatus Woesearchaeota archaeon]